MYDRQVPSALFAWVVTVTLAACGGSSKSPSVNHPPHLGDIGVLSGASLGWPFPVTADALRQASDASDDDGDALSFRLVSVASGSLERDGAAIAPGALLADGDAPWTWHPLDGEPAVVDAFSVVAFDGRADSGSAVVVRIDVGPRRRLAAQWLGGYASAGGWQTSGASSPGSGDGMMRGPSDVISRGGIAYVVDSSNHRVLAVDVATGSSSWLGGVGVHPTGGAPGCSAVPTGGTTPGWCIGGSALRSSAPGGLYYPSRVAIDGTSLFVTDVNGIVEYDLTSGAFVRNIPTETFSRYISGYADGIAVDATYVYVTVNTESAVFRVERATGAPRGWLGRVGEEPSSCTGAMPVVGVYSGSWCSGGSSQPGAGAGELTYPRGLGLVDGKLYVASSNGIQRYDVTTGAVDAFPAVAGNDGVSLSGGKLYASMRYSVRRYDATTGALEAWLGRIRTAPTSCELMPIPAAGELTGSWCTGGTAAGAEDDTRPGALDRIGGLSAVGGELLVANTGSDRIEKFDLASGEPLAWIGAVAGGAVSGWTAQDEPGPAEGTGDGMLQSATGVAFSSSDDALYVASRYRISKFRASTGTFLGWTGRTESAVRACVGTTPSTVPGPTTSFCSGGLPAAGFDDGELGPALRIAANPGFVFVADRDTNRILRFTSDGSFAGWIGTIGSTYGISPAACAAAGVNAFTPDWCHGGSSKVDPSAHWYLLVDLSVSGNTIVVADAQEKVMKVDGTPGAVRFIGWTGAVGPDEADVPETCLAGVVPQPGEATGGWCAGGASASGVSDGTFVDLWAVTQDEMGNIYALDFYRVTKLAPEGHALGWVGTIDGTITGGACDGATGQTPGWCTGGTAGWGPLAVTSSVAYDAEDRALYVGDLGLVHRLDATTGAYLGWAGGVASAPTGGGPGCVGAAVGSLTPSWCLGGVAMWTSMHDGIAADDLTAATGYLYAADARAGRVTRLTKHEQ